MKAEKMKLSKELRNAERRRQRLKDKAKELSTEDLVAVLVMRQQSAAKRAKKSEASATPAEEDANPASTEVAGNPEPSGGCMAAEASEAPTKDHSVDSEGLAFLCRCVRIMN